MPIGVFRSVREVSSEDPVHKAENLLKQLPGKKWKTKTSGEKSAVVVLEFEEPTQITAIDIGNEHSAFVEILVSKTDCATDNFTEILFTSSFMTPIESKNSTNTNRVRCFDKTVLTSTVLPDKWKFVKIICTQPFNKHVQYGLSFIKVQVAVKSVAEKANNVVLDDFFPIKPVEKTIDNGPRIASLGRYILKDESPDSETETTSTIFKRWKSTYKNRNECSPSPAAKIRAASKFAELSCSYVNKAANISLPSSSSDNDIFKPIKKNDDAQILDHKRKSILFDDDDSYIGNPIKQKLLLIEIEKDKINMQLEQNTEKKEKQENLHDNTASAHTSASTSAKVAKNESSFAIKNDTKDKSLEVRKSLKRTSSSPKKQENAKKSKPEQCVQYRSFNKLLEGVVLVISGIQNPDRATLRSQAIALGAKYKADWDRECTHLICAFKNTPKYNQVKGKGKIVTRGWIEKCYTLKKYLPWRRYAIDSVELDKPESDTEILDESLRPIQSAANSNDEGTLLTNEKNGALLSMYSNNNSQIIGCDGSDTDDEIERVIQKNKLAKKNENSHDAIKDVYDMTTEEEDYRKQKSSRPNLFFDGLTFFICSDVGASDRIKLETCIKKYGGLLQSSLTGVSCYAISNEPLSDLDAQKFIGVLVQPLWIYECDDMEALVSTKNYLMPEV